MSNVNATNNVSGASAASAPVTAGKSILGKDDFLKIFLAQLAHQDPTSPVDSQAFVSQLAQFSSLELQQNANSNLEAIMMGQAAAQQTAVTGLVGKDVVYKTSTFTLEAGKGATIEASLAADAGSVSAVITDASGRTVRTLQLGPNSEGLVDIAWDGRDDSGATQPAGAYSVAVTASDKSGAKVAVEQQMQGHVSGVSFKNGAPELSIGNQSVSLSNVIEIKERIAP